MAEFRRLKVTCAQDVSPKEFLAEIIRLVKNEVFRTWVLETYEGSNYFTHAPQQWFRKAWLRPSAASDCVIFRVVFPKGRAYETAIAAVFIGRMSESLITHLGEQISALEILE